MSARHMEVCTLMGLTLCRNATGLRAGTDTGTVKKASSAEERQTSRRQVTST